MQIVYDHKQRRVIDQLGHQSHQGRTQGQRVGAGLTLSQDRKKCILMLG